MSIKVKSGHRIENVPFVFTLSSVTLALRWRYSCVTLALLLFGLAYYGLAVDISSHSKHEHVTRGSSRLRVFYEPPTASIREILS